MNLYIWSHSTDESDTEEYIKFSEKCCIGCMSAYVYGYYVYVHNRIDAPNEHNNNFILNQIPGFYIKSLSKLMDDTFT